jgi:hypothetical protein
MGNAASNMRGRRLLWTVPIVTLLLLLVRLRVPGGDGLDARYYDSPAATGAAAHSTVDPAPSTGIVRERWLGAVPGRFSVTWSGYLTVTQPGSYQLATTSDDGSQLFIDDVLIVDNGGLHSLRTRSATVRLTSGPHRVKLVFVNEGGDFSFEWAWAREGRRMSTVPAWLLSTVPVGARSAYAARIIDLGVRILALPALVVVLWSLMASRRALHPSSAALRRMRRGIAVTAALLPAFLAAHAFAFWGRGVIDQEATTFVINYLADRPFLQAIFDPRLNDWGSFQARELSYVFDRMDARVFARLLADDRALLFVPMSSVLCVPALCLVFVTGARRVLRLDRTTALLLLSLFLSCIVFQASVPILYRSSKMLLSVAVLAFLFAMMALLKPGRAPIRLRSAAGLFALGVLMPMCDRQGYAYLLSATVLATVLWARQRWLPSAWAERESSEPRGQPGNPSSPHRQYGPVALACSAATFAAVTYNNVVAPYAILRANGYRPDMSYEDIPFERFDGVLARNTLRMFEGQVSMFFGNLPFAAACALGAALWAACALQRTTPAPWGIRRWLTSAGVIVSAGFIAVLIVLIAVMGMRHPPVFTIVDHAFWYYTLSIQALLLFGAALAISRLPPADSGGTFIHALLIALLVSNVLHYRGQRELLAGSGQWFGKQLAFAQLYAQSFDALDHSSRVADPLPSWMRVLPDGIAVDLPPRGYGLLDAVRAGYLTLEKRQPFDRAAGPYWRELREFLDGAGSPLSEPEHLHDAVAALQQIGVRRIVVHRHMYERAADADAVIAEAKSLHGRVSDIVDGGDAVRIQLPDTDPGTQAHGDWRRVPASAMHITVSEHDDQAPLMLDERNDTGWTTTEAQSGHEWIRIVFDRPRRLTAVELLVTDQALERHPRALSIESTGTAGTRTLFSGSPLPALFRGILTRPVDAPIVLPLPSTETSEIVVRQTGRSPSWSWSVRELVLYE